MSNNRFEDTRRENGTGGFIALPAGTMLERYQVDSVMGVGGFGITYLCHHVTLGKSYAIKEHFPRQFAYRDSTTTDVRQSDPEVFSWALDRFIQEGRSLAKCQHPNVVSVADVFEANQTAYMVLGYEDGKSLKAWLEGLGRRPTQAELDRILGPLLDALAYVHAQGLLHRDVALDNIMIRSDGSPCLIDFGAARHAITERSHVMSTVVKTGYSPPEQYTRSGRAQGPWTDIYALGATLYRMLTGVTPPESPDRQVDDELRPIREAMEGFDGYRSEFLDAIDRALVLHYGDRPQTIAAWRVGLLDDAPPPEASPGGSAPHASDVLDALAAERPVPRVPPSAPPSAGPGSAAPPRRLAPLLLAGAVMAVLAGAGALWIAGTPWWATTTPQAATKEQPVERAAPSESAHQAPARKKRADDNTRKEREAEAKRANDEKAARDAPASSAAKDAEARAAEQERIRRDEERRGAEAKEAEAKRAQEAQDQQTRDALDRLSRDVATTPATDPRSEATVRRAPEDSRADQALEQPGRATQPTESDEARQRRIEAEWLKSLFGKRNDGQR